MSLKRAAFIVELDDATRMIYELHGPITVTVTNEYDGFSHLTGTFLERQNVTIEGTLGRGTVWHGDTPTTTPAELTTGQKEIPA